MASKLDFDLERMASFHEIVVTFREQLDSDKTDLKEYLTQLEADWNTDAGKKFFKENLGDWEVHVDTYVKLLEVLEQMMETAISQYTEVRDKAKGSSIHLS